MEKLTFNLNKYKPDPKAPAYHWQDLALKGFATTSIREYDITMPRKKSDPKKRFWSKVKKFDSGCWEFQSYRLRGYATFSLDKKTLKQAHRYSYEITKGEIPKGFHIDHLCRNRACVNPDHLEAVTPRENIMRSNSHVAVNARKTHCKRGHELSGENLYMQANTRQCRKCKAIRAKLRMDRVLKENPNYYKERWQTYGKWKRLRSI